MDRYQLYNAARNSWSGAQPKPKTLWETLNSNKMANSDSLWGGVVGSTDAMARSLGMQPIQRGPNPQEDQARLDRARAYYRTSPVQLTQFPGGNTPQQTDKQRFWALQGTTPAPAQTTPARLSASYKMGDMMNGRYLSDAEKLKIALTRQQRGKRLDFDAQARVDGAGVKPRMSDAELLTQGAPAPSMASSLGIPSVPAPAYAATEGARPISDMRTGRDYITQKAQIESLARQNRMSGMHPSIAQLMAVNDFANQQQGLTAKGFQEQLLGNERDANVMDYNAGLYGARVGESLGRADIGLRGELGRGGLDLGRGELDLRERERQDRVEAAQAEAEMRRKALESLMGGSMNQASANPTTPAGAAAYGLSALQGRTAQQSNPLAQALAAQMLMPQSEIGSTILQQANRPQPMTPFQAVMANAAASGVDPAQLPMIAQQLAPVFGGGQMAPVANLPSAPTTGVNDDYVRSLVQSLPQEMTPDQMLSTLQGKGVTRAHLEDLADANKAPSLYDQLNAEAGMPFLRWIERLTGSRAKSKRNLSRYDDMVKRLKSLGVAPVDASQWWNAPMSEPSR